MCLTTRGVHGFAECQHPSRQEVSPDSRGQLQLCRAGQEHFDRAVQAHASIMTHPTGAAGRIAQLQEDIEERVATPQQRHAWQNQIDNLHHGIPPPPPRKDHYVCTGAGHQTRYGIDPDATRLASHCGCKTSTPSSPSSSLFTRYTYDSVDGTR